MTKKIKIENEATKVTPEKRRKLTHAEEEEYTRLMNEAWQPVREAIEEGKIQALWWRQAD